MKNITMLQYFEWYLPSDANHWNRAAEDAEYLASLGITDVWMPPAYKGFQGKEDVGYGVYDMYDLGEFDQKGGIPTKYGTKDEYLACIKTLQEKGVRVIGDLVMNHRMGADGCELLEADVMASDNRNWVLSEDQKIKAWTKFTFPGRGGKYSTFCWNASHFDGVDYDANSNRNGLFRFDGQNWDDQVNADHGNYDYLMGADLDFRNEEVIREMERWGKWYFDFTGIDGVRLDAVKHIRADFYERWLKTLRSQTGRDFFAVGEYWNGDVNVLGKYLDDCGGLMQLFDVPLHYDFFAAAQQGSGYDLRTIFDNTLTARCPWLSVTFVDNHDSQPGQALQSWVQDWFRPLAYALILLRLDGIPCVFYGDLKGIPHDGIAPMGEQLEKMIAARQTYATGAQTDYFDFPNVVGWTREGGAAVVISNGDYGWKHMKAGVPGQVYIDLLGNRDEQIVIGEDGWADFTCNGNSVSVWIPMES
jgi:alpha-amylase